MSSRRRYLVTIEWPHRKFGPQLHRSKAEGTSIRRAISNALVAFFTDKNAGPKARRDAHAAIKVSATRTKEKADK